MEFSEPTRRLRVDLGRAWLIWSCMPLAGMVLALLATTAVYASQPVLSIKRAEDSFYQFLAISAIVFLFTFTIDGHWTNPKRLAESIRRLAGDEDSKLAKLMAEEKIEAGVARKTGTRDKLERIMEQVRSVRAEIASHAVLTSSTALGLLGHAIGFAAIMCMVAGAGRSLSFLLLSVAVSYQLFLFSRHPYYERIVEAAYAGELEAEESPKDKRKRRKDANSQE